MTIEYLAPWATREPWIGRSRLVQQQKQLSTLPEPTSQDCFGDLEILCRRDTHRCQSLTQTSDAAVGHWGASRGKGGSGCGRQGRVLRFWSGIHVSEADSAHLTGHPDLAMNGQFDTNSPDAGPDEIRACLSMTREQTMPCRNETGETWKSGYQTLRREFGWV